jgi:hypothetical protein
MVGAGQRTLPVLKYCYRSGEIEKSISVEFHALLLNISYQVIMSLFRIRETKEEV